VIGLLAAGAVINVAVAWGCMIHAYHNSKPLGPYVPDFVPTADDQNWWKRRSPKGMVPPDAVNEYKYVGYRERRVFGDGPLLNVNPPGTLRELSVRSRAGWPLAGVYCEWFSVADPQGPRGIGRVTRGCFDPASHPATASLSRVVPVIPLTPLFPGFAINTLFYAAVCWLLLFAPFALRRRLRRRRGLCPACAYQVGSSDVCTECGAPVR